MRCPLLARDRKPRARLLGFGEAGARVSPPGVCEFGRLRSFHVGVAHPYRQSTRGLSKTTGGQGGDKLGRGVGRSGVGQTLSLHLPLFPSSLWTKWRSCLSVGPHCVPSTVLNNAAGAVCKGGDILSPAFKAPRAAEECVKLPQDWSWNSEGQGGARPGGLPAGGNFPAGPP